MKHTRPIALGLFAISVVVFLVSGGEMARRIARYNETRLAATPFFQPINLTSFTFADRPVQIRTHTGTGGEPDEVHVTFGDESLTLTETIPGGVDELDTLVRHREWLRVFRFALAKGMTVDEVEAAIKADEIDDRLVFVTRTPPAGADASTWGEVWAKEWNFDLYELTADGQIVHERLAYPSRRAGEAPKEGELEEGTWQYHAALLTMPPRRGPKPRFGNDAVNDFGWTYAGVGVSAVLGAIAAAFLFAPSRRPKQAQTEQPADAQA